MKTVTPRVIPLLFISLLLSAAGRTQGAGLVAPGLERAIQADEKVSFIVRFSPGVDLQQFGSPAVSQSALIEALQTRARVDQQPAIATLQAAGAERVIQLWAINALAVTARAAIVPQLAALPGVERIEADATVQAPVPSEASASVTEWNLDAVRAPEFWGQGYTGVGVVVASMDTGVDPDHPDLAARWRGGGNSWFDPNGEHAAPYDRTGHGTQVMGLAVGGDTGGSAIGVAPGAQWIAVKIFDDDGLASLSAIHQGFQWLLDPDQDPGTDDSPHVVNNSWGFPELSDQCYLEFAQDIDVLKAAGINVVFAAGNTGPSAYSSVSPANNPQGYAVGAVDSTLSIASTSSRGASACGATLYPEVVAPGVSVKTADLTFNGLFPDSYAWVAGTSAAAPHVAGAMALLREAFPQASVADIEQALMASALDLAQAGPDNDTGHGLIDVPAASALLASQPPPPPPPTCSDGDADGFFAEADCGTLVDCDDANALANPDACDIKNDGIDQDCDGADRLRGKSCPDASGDGGGDTGADSGSEGKGGTCSDGIDNDGDSLIDCLDGDCARNKACRVR